MPVEDSSGNVDVVGDIVGVVCSLFENLLPDVIVSVNKLILIALSVLLLSFCVDIVSENIVKPFK